MPNEHAFLSASSASRWLVCTAAPHFEARFPDSVSEYAVAGTLAHSFCELKALKKFTPMGPKAYTTRLNKLKKEPLYEDEMDRTSDLYVEHLAEKSMSYKSMPFVTVEVRVDFSEYVPEGFGTCDCVMIGDDLLDITDYKHGKGVPVSAEDNPQMRLYALGALKQYEPFYGGMIHRVRMTIDQPRIQDGPSSETLTVEELRAWGESIRPAAQIAHAGPGEFVPGDHCRFCRGRSHCRARADVFTALEDFKDLQIPSAETATGGMPGNLLTLAEVGALLERGKHLVAWYRDLEESALLIALSGQEVPGWKVVAGRSIRSFSDTDAALAAVLAAGYDEALVYERRAKTLTELEKLMGKTDFEEKIGAYVIKPLGKPTLAPESDARPPYNSAASDFEGV